MEIGQNENLGESSENFQFQRSLCQRKFKTYHGTLQHMQFCKEIHAVGQGETTGTIISAEPDNKMKYREEGDNIFTKLVHWKKIIFDLPEEALGKAFINALTKLINKSSSKLPNRDICLKSLIAVSSLILQESSSKCKTLEIKSHYERRLNLSKNKDVASLLNETRMIQKRLPQRQKP